MKTGTVSLNNASLHIGYSQVVKPNQRGLLREITEFFVPETQRGKGEGTALLESVCEQADDEGIFLLIRPDNIRLGAFYARHGFETLQGGKNTFMIRKPIVL